MLTESQINILKGFGNRIVQSLKEQLSNKKINAGGDLSASIHYEITDSGMVVKALDYLFYADFGRKPGKRPPKDAIKEWIQEKHIQSKIPIDSLAFIIQRNIAKKGTKAFQKQGNKIVESVLTDELIIEIQEAFRDDFIKEIRSDFQKMYELPQAA